MDEGATGAAGVRLAAGGCGFSWNLSGEDVPVAAGGVRNSVEGEEILSGEVVELVGV
jgi:hypothetical protein